MEICGDAYASEPEHDLNSWDYNIFRYLNFVFNNLDAISKPINKLYTKIYRLNWIIKK